MAVPLNGEMIYVLVEDDGEPSFVVTESGAFLHFEVDDADCFLNNCTGCGELTPYFLMTEYDDEPYCPACVASREGET